MEEINRIIKPQISKLAFWQKYGVAAAFAAIATIVAVPANAKLVPVKMHQDICKSTGNAINESKYQIKITGKVADENDQPLPGVLIVVTGTRYGTQSNADGTFLLVVPEDRINKLTAYLIGYIETEITVNVTKQTDYLISMKKSQMMMGEMKVERTKRPFFTRAWDWIKQIF